MQLLCTAEKTATPITAKITPGRALAGLDQATYCRVPGQRVLVYSGSMSALVDTFDCGAVDVATAYDGHTQRRSYNKEA